MNDGKIFIINYITEHLADFRNAADANAELNEAELFKKYINLTPRPDGDVLIFKDEAYSELKRSLINDLGQKFIDR